MILHKFLSKKYDVLGIYDLADITTSPDRIYQILNQHRKDEFAPTEVIVFYTQYAASQELIDHMVAAAQLIDVDPSFIMLCGPVKLDSPFKFLPFKVESRVLGNNFTLPDTLCPIPWTTLEVRENGNISPCCMCTNDATVGVIQDGLQNTFYNDKMIKLRQEMLSGQKPKSCDNCWTREARGLVTNRIRHRSYLLKDLLIRGLDSPTITQLDLKFGKTCNFKCRICSSASSSAFAEEDARFRKIKFVIDKNWSEDVAYIGDVESLLPTLTNIDMFGGEPWLLKSFARFLKLAVETGHAKNIRLHYNTNGSVYPKELIQYWSEFREVDIHFSVDAIGDKFALERGGSWADVESNILRIKALNLPNVKFAIMPAISVMNIFYLDEVLAWAEQHEFIVNPQHVIDPEAFSLSQLTRNAKDYLLEKYKDHKWPEMKKILDSIQEMPDSDGAKFNARTRHFDSLRKENFADTHPEIAKAMGYLYNS